MSLSIEHVKGEIAEVKADLTKAKAYLKSAMDNAHKELVLAAMSLITSLEHRLAGLEAWLLKPALAPTDINMLCDVISKLCWNIGQIPDVKKANDAKFHPKTRPASSSSWTSADQSNFVRAVCDYYGAEHNFCFVAGHVDPTRITGRNSIVAAHIWDFRCRSALPVFGLAKDDVWNPKNGLRVCKPIKKAFDAGRVVLIYNPFNRKINMHVLDPQLKNQLALPSDKTFDDLDGAVVTFPNGNKPYVRLIAYLAADGIRMALEKNWVKAGDYEAYRQWYDLELSSIGKDELAKIESNIFSDIDAFDV